MPLTFNRACMFSDGALLAPPQGSMTMDIEAESKAIEALKGAALKQRYREVLGSETKSNNRPYIIRKIIDALRASPNGSPPTSEGRGRSKPPPADRKSQPTSRPERDPRLPEVGAILERVHEGRTVRVKVLENGFEYRGRTYRSLSAVANEATGTVWNGYLFFRLTAYPKRGRAAELHPERPSRHEERRQG